ncbi:WXG100 family type VII secretion target [Saccharopolyspora sp. K220]|uniref:WXG100 family type VII secretion target n=1 Tax=Saccharopolyspora soli TaxID=2926618 RepID=UPI001F5AFFE1|nr:WXG100 family type VII secretion target [Saccharopolyspora soli]MCI2423760.1 WXG100 family type VII secretion target [Saccharopolyspora soli]
MREIDIDKIRDVASKSWGGDDVGSLKNAAKQSVQMINDTKTYIAEGWEGEDFVAFSEQLESLRKAIDKVLEPAEEMSKALNVLASELEQTLSDTIATIAGFGALISTLASVAGAAVAIPEPTVSKVIALIAGILAAIFSAVALTGAIIKGNESRQKAVNAVIQQCTGMVGVLKFN